MSLYRKPKRPLVQGDLRMKSWRTLESGVAQNDPTWAARCRQYWEVQERLFGFRASDFTMAIDNENGFVSTYVVVLEILPGERTADFDRVPVASTHVASMRQ